MRLPSSRTRWVSFISATLVVASAAVVRAQTPRPLRVGLVADGPTGDAVTARARILDALREVLEGDFSLEIPDEARVEGAWTVESVDAALDRVLARRDLDLVVTLGLIASHRAGIRSRLSVPVVAAFVVDPMAQGLPVDPKRGVSGRPRFTYVANPQLIGSDLAQLKDLFRANKVAYFLTGAFRRSVPGLEQRVRDTASDLGLELVFVDVDEGPEAALASLPADVDGAYVGVLPRLDVEQLKRLLDGLAARDVPTFAQGGRPVIELGALAGIADGIDIPRRARRVALDVQRIALGESAANVPVYITRTRRLVINMKTAREIGFWPDWKALTEAELLERERDDVTRRLTLEEAAREAVERNLDLLANAQSVEANRKEIARARARLFPNAEASLRGTWIDRDRTASLQNRAERQIDLSLSGEQVIYDERAYANLKVQKYIQESVEFDYESLKLDIIRAATQAYLDVLRSSTIEQIQVRNLELTRSNRELAVVRRAIGVAGPSEVYRWDSQLASDQSAVIDAIAQRNAAEIALNQILNQPLEEPFTTAESEMDDPLDLLKGSVWTKAVENPYTFKLFRGFMSEVGIEASPALDAIDAGIAATRRGLVAAKRAWWLPSFGLQGQLGYVVAQDGNGSEDFDPSQLPPDAQPIIGSLPVPDDVTWLLGVSASYPLFTGLERLADLKQANLELEQQRLERQSIALRTEEQIRQALHIAGASYAAIGLSRESAEAARKNLEVIRDAYAEGTTGYLNLLDAQNQALVEEQVASNAVYDFLSDLMDVQRAINRFIMLEDPGQQAEFRRRMAEYFQTSNRPVSRSAAEPVDVDGAEPSGEGVSDRP